MKAVSASGTSSMSDASMPFQPAIDEPSNAWPLSNLSSSNADTGTETCCSLPRVSVKRKSTNLTSSSLTICMTSATDLLITYLLINEFGGFSRRPNLADPSRHVYLALISREMPQTPKAGDRIDRHQISSFCAMYAPSRRRGLSPRAFAGNRRTPAGVNEPSFPETSAPS